MARGGGGELGKQNRGRPTGRADIEGEVTGKFNVAGGLLTERAVVGRESEVSAEDVRYLARLRVMRRLPEGYPGTAEAGPGR